MRPAVIIGASAAGMLVPAIARLVPANEDTVRDVIRLFDAKGLAVLDPWWAGGRSRLISDDDVEVIVAAAKATPGEAGPAVQALTPAQAGRPLASRDQPAGIGRERLRQVLHAHGISFQRTRAWNDSADRTGAPSRT
jgi:transposase